MIATRWIDLIVHYVNLFKGRGIQQVALSMSYLNNLFGIFNIRKKVKLFKKIKSIDPSETKKKHLLYILISILQNVYCSVF